MIPQFDGVNSLILEPSASEAKQTYQAVDLLKGKIKSVTINHRKTGSPATPDELIYDASSRLQFSRDGNNVLIIDESTQRKIIAKDAFNAPDSLNINLIIAHGNTQKQVYSLKHIVSNIVNFEKNMAESNVLLDSKALAVYSLTDQATYAAQSENDKATVLAPWVILKSPNNTDSLAWYHTGLKKRIVGQGISISDNPKIIGLTTSDEKTKVYINSNQGLYYAEVNAGNAPTNNFTKVGALKYTRKNSALWKGTDSDNVLEVPPMVAGISRVILEGGNGSDVYDLNLKGDIKNIIINNYATDGAIDSLKLKVANYREVLVSKESGHLLITKTDRTANVTILNTFIAEKENYNHLDVVFNDGTTERKYAAAYLANKFTELTATNTLSDSFALSLFDKN